MAREGLRRRAETRVEGETEKPRLASQTATFLAQGLF